MDKLKIFIKGTQVPTRILFVLWIILSIISKFSEESKLLIVIEYAVMFLLPAAMIEIKNNPLFDRSESQTIKFVKRAKLASKILFYLWFMTSIIILSDAGWHFQNVATSLIAGTILFLFLIIIIERKNSSLNDQSIDNTIPNKPRQPSDRRIPKSLVAGLGFAPLAIAGLIAFIQNPIDDSASGNIGIAIVFGLLTIIFLLVSVYSPKTKTEAAKRKAAKLTKKELQKQKIARQKRMMAYKGIFLSEQQIQNLENRIELPVVDTPVFLSYGEVAVYYSVATRQETKNFEGELILTNKRLVFLSDQKGLEIPYSAITAATIYSDGLSIQSKNHTYTLILPKANLAVIAFNAVRTGDIPLANTVDYVADKIDYELVVDKEEMSTGDISSIDGMDGHEFEYFCAGLLRKNNFCDVKVTPGSGDQGVDILGEKSGVKYAIQCKNYAAPLNNTPVQEVYAGKTFYGCHVGVVMTNSTFTHSAVNLAKATGVLLWDRAVVEAMMLN